MKKIQAPQSLISQERKQNPIIYACFLSLLLSGFIPWLWDVHNVFNQWLILVHSITGLFFITILIFFITTHFKRTLGQRRSGLIVSGVLLTALLAYLSLTGLRITWFGSLESEPNMQRHHVFAAIASVFILAFHIISHVYFMPERRKNQLTIKTHNTQINSESLSTYLPSLPKKTSNTAFLSGILTLLIPVLLTAAYTFMNTETDTSPAVSDYQYPYGPHPFRPSQTETQSKNFINKSLIAGSEHCADCHTDIALQWYSSMHKQAASDPTYVTNISLLAEKKGIAATRYCEGCHAPIALLTGQLSEGGTHGGIADTTAFNEGISCLSCHNITKPIHLKGVASFEYAPHTPYLFYGSNNPALKSIHHFLVRAKPDQHKKDMNRDILKDPKVCATCHVQFMDKGMNDWGWVKMQDEYTAWLESPFSQQSEHSFSHQEVTRCHDCHMPLTAGNDPSTNQSGEFRSHRFLGANTMMPTLNGDEEQLLATIAFLQSNKMRVTIETPNRQEATQSEKYIDESLRNDTEAPAYFYLNEKVEIQVIVTNVGVGHNFPGGTIDINEAWLEFNVIDAAGQRIFHSGFVKDDLTVDPDAHFYRSRPIDRFGNEVWKHDLFNRVGETYKKVVPSGESDVVTYNFSIPSWAQGPITATAVLKYRKLNLRYAKWALKEQYMELPIVDIGRHSISIPIRDQAKTTEKFTRKKVN